MSKKAKGIILIILLVLCLGGIVLEIKLLYPKYIKKNPSTSNNKQQIDDKNNNNQNDKQNTNGDEKNKENNINVYDRYSNMKLAGTSLKPYDNMEVKLVDGKLECDDLVNDWCSLSSSITDPIKKISFSSRMYASDIDLYILTETGKIFKLFNPESNNTEKIKPIMTNYTIIDMTEPYTNYRYGIPSVVNTMWMEIPHKDVYFLTQDGELISEDGNTYETDNRDFVRSNCFYYDEHTTLLFCLYYDKENHVSYKVATKGQNSVDYKDFKNRLGEDLIAKYVYDSIEHSENNPFERKTLITDENDDLYVIEYVNNDFVINYLGKVISVTCDKSTWMLTFTMSDGTTYHFKSAETDYFDVASKKAVPFNNN